MTKPDPIKVARHELDRLKARRNSIFLRLGLLETSAALAYDTAMDSRGNVTSQEDLATLHFLAGEMDEIESQATAARRELEG